VFCVLCFVFCVLCFVFCVLCFVFCVLCFVFCFRFVSFFFFFLFFFLFFFFFFFFFLFSFQYLCFHAVLSWGDASKRRAFFDRFAQDKGFDPLVPGNWYSITTRSFHDHQVCLVFFLHMQKSGADNFRAMKQY
jgi:hypothetical protein